MYSFQQEELFSFEDLMEFEAEAKYTAILSHLPIGTILHAISGSPQRGRPESINTRAMIYSLLIAKIERIPFTSDLILRLKRDSVLRKCCRFTDSDRIPSKASYSRLVTKLHQCGVLRLVHDSLVDAAISEGFISGEVVAVDSSHIEAFDRNPRLNKKKEIEQPQEPEPEFIPATDDARAERIKPQKPKRGKRGRPSKEEQAAWEETMLAYKSSLTKFEVEIAEMLSFSYEELVTDMPQYPSSGAKGGNHRNGGHLKYWYGYKLNVVVDTASQYIITGLICSGHVNDGRMGILLLKRLQERYPALQVKHVLADKGYEGLPMYQQAQQMNAFALTPLIQHAKELPPGVDKYFRPVCQKGHSYRYDSYDPKYDTLKYTQPKECGTCPLLGTGCQAVHKIKREKDIRKYTVPARGSSKFATLYSRRTAVERVFAYLKSYFGLTATRKRKKRAFVEMDLTCLTYTLCKFALDKLNQELRRTRCAA